MSWAIYYDDIQEGIWFASLDRALKGASLEPITGAVNVNPKLRAVLQYDRPDVILAYEGEPVLVLERTVEVPSGHNVGQRFARLAAAAENHRPLVYFGPFVAYKHGGETAGPRWMNLRLFWALDVLARIHGTALTTIQWPVDANYEIVQGSKKDLEMREYMKMFMEAFEAVGPAGINDAIKESSLQKRLLQHREGFVAGLKAASRYQRPPPSVRIVKGEEASAEFGIPELASHDELVIYNIGMKYIRSDPYTGSAMLYRYLYVLGHPELDRRLILHFPNVNGEMWDLAAATDRKDIRLYRHAADGIIFSNAYRDRSILIADPGL